MSEIYGAQFANQYGQVGGESFQTWVLALRDLTAEDIKYGFTKLLERERTFVPNLNEFRLLCKKTPEDLGMPSLKSAFNEVSHNASHVLSHKWSHPAVYESGRLSGWYELRGGFISEKQFKVIYEQVCNQVMSGKKFIIPDITSNVLECHNHGKAVSARDKNNNLKIGNAALGGLKGLFR